MLRNSTEKRGHIMKNRTLSEALKSLLCEKLPKEEKEKLEAEGYVLKSPTRKSAIAIALYKKAEKGDLSAAKEIINLLSEKEIGEKGTVTIIDDTGNKNI